MKAIVVITAAAVAAFTPMAASAIGLHAHHGWRCDAYGLGGPRSNTWQTVTGDIRRTEAEAKQDAETNCARQRHLNACHTCGCWPE